MTDGLFYTICFEAEAKFFFFRKKGQDVSLFFSFNTLYCIMFSTVLSALWLDFRLRDETAG